MAIPEETVGQKKVNKIYGNSPTVRAAAEYAHVHMYVLPGLFALRHRIARALPLCPRVDNC